MTIAVISGRRYHRHMANLPSPARALTLSAINADYAKYLAELEQGGAILVYSDDRQALLGVLTRDPAVFGDARLAQQIEAATCRRSSSCSSTLSTIPPRDRLRTSHAVSASRSSPTVTEVLRFEDLPLGSRGSRRALVRWSDGSEDEAMRWYADEILICEGDLIGKTRDQLRSLHFRRDRDWLQS